MQNWHAIEGLRWAGPFSLAGIIVCGTIPALKTLKSPGQSISQSWAIVGKQRWFTSAALTVFGAGLSASVIGWLVPTYKLWAGMYLVTSLSYLACLTVAWFPMMEKPGEHSYWHPHFIGGATVAYGAVAGYAIILLAGAPIPPISRYLTVSALIYSALWPIFFHRAVRKYFIYLEITLVALFMSVVTSLTIG